MTTETQQALDRVVIAAAVKAAVGRTAVIRRVRNRWVREGRVALQRRMARSFGGPKA